MVQNGNATEKKITNKYELFFSKKAAKLQRVPDTVRQASVQQGRMMIHEVTTYFDVSTHKVTEAQNFNGEDMLVESYLGSSANGVEKTDETKDIAGFLCKKVILKTPSGDISIWYTTKLPFVASPFPTLWTKGVVLGIEGNNLKMYATSVEYGEVKDSEFTIPSKGTVISLEDFKKKMEEMRAKNPQGPVMKLYGQ
jgi:GLPGLI family protein